MSIRFEAVHVENRPKVLDADGFFDLSKGMGAPDRPGTMALVAHGASDGIAVNGTAEQLHDWLNQARDALMQATGGPRAITMIDLSTNHLPAFISEGLDTFDGVRAAEMESGWLLHVPSDLAAHVADHCRPVGNVRLCDIPVEVIALWEYARRFGATYILLDRDAECVADLPVWDW